MVGLIQLLRRKFPGLWKVIESVNAVLVDVFLERRLRTFVHVVEASLDLPDWKFRAADDRDADVALSFFCAMDEADLRYFRPFEFSVEGLNPVLRGRGFRVFLAEGSRGIEGIFFVRVFFDGRAFLGFAVAGAARGKGLGTAMVRALVLAARASRIDLYSTVSLENSSSRRAHDKAGRFEEVERLPDGYLLLKSIGDPSI